MTFEVKTLKVKYVTKAWDLHIEIEGQRGIRTYINHLASLISTIASYKSLSL